VGSQDRDRCPHPRRGDDRRPRASRQPGYAISQQKRKRTEEPFGWAKTIGGLARPMLRGAARLRFKFTFTMAAYDLIRLPNRRALRSLVSASKSAMSPASWSRTDASEKSRTPGTAALYWTSVRLAAPARRAA
jgi:hypothetical protein